jgi:two-component system phosphate regulon sensor histidine kinase PhoR
MPLTEVDRAVYELRKTLGIASLLALAVAVLLSSVAAQLTSRTLRHITGAARRMAGGDLATRTRAAGHDEIAALGQALDQLAESLSGSLGELRSERDLLGGILSGMQEGVLVADGAGHIVLINPALRAMLVLQQEATGKSVLQTIRNAELNALLERARQGPTPPVEIELAGLKPRRVLAHAAALTGAPGTLLAVFVDVTELRRLESMRREFVANASHELRTPVAAVRSAAETLRSAMDDRVAASRFLEIIERNARRLESLVEDLLELSRIESREYRLTLEPVELPSAVSHVLSLYIMLSTELASGLPPVRADRRALEQVCVNLIDNALKYCPEGARVTVRAAADGNMVRVAVEDNGPGIEHKHLPRLFERFYRVDAGRSRELGGTGLGLSIVKHLVEAMGGTVGVHSKPGDGATFTVTFPRA